MDYIIPTKTVIPFNLGTHVEIFSAWYEKQSKGPIRVKVMRVDGKVLCLGTKCSDMKEPITLRPHEGDIVSIDRRLEGIHFKIDMAARRQ